MHKERQRTK